MKPVLPDTAARELADRFFYPLLDLIEGELEHGSDNIQIAMILALFTAWVARRDPHTAYATLTLLADDLKKAADEARS